MNASKSGVDSNILSRWRDVNFIIAQYKAFDAHITLFYKEVDIFIVAIFYFLLKILNNNGHLHSAPIRDAALLMALTNYYPRYSRAAIESKQRSSISHTHFAPGWRVAKGH